MLRFYIIAADTPEQLTGWKAEGSNPCRGAIEVISGEAARNMDAKAWHEVLDECAAICEREAKPC